MPLSTMLPDGVESGRGLCMLRVWVAWVYVIEGVSGDYCLDRVPFRRWQRQHERDPPHGCRHRVVCYIPRPAPFGLSGIGRQHTHSRQLLNQ